MSITKVKTASREEWLKLRGIWFMEEYVEQFELDWQKWHKRQEGIKRKGPGRHTLGRF